MFVAKYFSFPIEFLFLFNFSLLKNLVFFFGFSCGMLLLGVLVWVLFSMQNGNLSYVQFFLFLKKIVSYFFFLENSLR